MIVISAAARRAEDGDVVAGHEAPRLQRGADGPGLVVELAPRHALRLAVGASPTRRRSGRPVGRVGRLLEPLDRRRRHCHIREPRYAAPSECSGHPSVGRRRARLGSHRHSDGPTVSSGARHADRRRRPAAPVHGRARPGDRAALAGAVGRRRHVRGAEPGRSAGRPRGRRRPRPEAVRARHVPVPVGHRACTSATRSASSAPTSTAATSGWPATTCCTRWASTPSACPPSSSPCRPAQHPAITTAENVATYRRQLRRLGLSHDRRRVDRHHRPRLLPLDAVDLHSDLRRPGTTPTPPTRPAASAAPGRSPSCAPSSTTAPATLDDGRRWSRAVAVRAGRRHRRPPPGLRLRRAGQLVPRPRHRRRQRGGHRRRPQRPRQLPGVQAQHAPVDDAHHRLRRPPDRRPRRARLDRLDQDDAAQLDRPLARRAASTSTRRPGRSRVFTTRPDTLFGATFMVLAPEHPLVDDLTTSRGGAGGRSSTAARREPRRTSTARTRTARRPACSPGQLRDQPGHRRGHPDLDRRLRADGLRHRGDHGRAVRRPARLRVRQQVRPGDPRRSSGRPTSGSPSSGIEPTLDTSRWPEAFVGDAPYVNSANGDLDLNGIDSVGRGRRRDQRLAGGQRRRRGDDHLQAARLAVQPPALLGRAVPDRLRRRRPPARPARRRCCR